MALAPLLGSLPKINSRTFTGSVTSPITIPNGVNEQPKIELNLDTAKLNFTMSALSSDNSATPDMVESIKSQVKDELTKLKENFKVIIGRVRESNGQYSVSEHSINSWSSFVSVKPSFNNPQFIGSTLNIRGYDQNGNISEGSSHGFIDVRFSTSLKCR
jgi:hypothetical protein